MNTRVLHRRGILTIAAIVLAVWPVHAQELSVAGNGEVAVGSTAMVTTAHPLASQAAMAMLRQGGNAVDAAVAAAFAVGVVEPDGSGIGGSGGMVVYLRKQNRAVYVNYYAEASEQINSVTYDPNTDSRSAKAVLIPGTVAGLALALERYGTLPLATVLEPAITYAEEGFPIDATLAGIMLDNVALLQKYPSTEAVFLPDGFPLIEGDTLRQPELAMTLRAIAERGRAGFYDGPIAKAMVEAVRSNGGALTEKDLLTYEPVITEPRRGTYRGYQVLSAAAPQSGSALIQTLNMLEFADLRSMGQPSTSAPTLHLMAEVFRRSYADRAAFLDDPRFADLPLAGMESKSYARARFDDINRLMADPPEYRQTKAGNPMAYVGDDAASARPQQVRDPDAPDFEAQDDEGYIRGRTDDMFDSWGRKKQTKPAAPSTRSKQADSTQRRRPDPDNDIGDARVPRGQSRPGSEAMPLGLAHRDRLGAPTVEAETLDGGGHTTHLSVVDAEGNAVSLTQTLGTFFGSGLTVQGILLNTSMSNFARTTAVNAVRPRKQPRSSICPTIVLKDDRPFMTVGSPGAARIIATVAQLVVNVIDFGMDAGEANRAPRFFCQKFDDHLHVEGRVTPDVRTQLERMGHSVRVYGDVDLFFGGVQMILVDQAAGRLYGSADPRRGGVAIGF